MRLKGLSLLDYLWVNYGQYSVSNTLEENTIPTSSLLLTITDKIASESVSSIKMVGSYLVGVTSKNKELFRIDVSEIASKGKVVTNFGKRYITEEDVLNGIDLDEGTPVYFLKFSDGTELVTQIENYTGAETDSVVVRIVDDLIHASLKINNLDSIVPLNITKEGLQADLKLSQDNSSIQLTKELDGLKALIILDNQGRSLKFKLMTLDSYLNLLEKDYSTIYFIEGKEYFYFGEYLIGDGTTNLDNYYTKDEINNLQPNSATKEYIDNLLAGVGMNWNTI